MNKKQAITRALSQLEAAKKLNDEEVAHIKADEALCELLESIGCGEAVELWRSIGKWYA